MSKKEKETKEETQQTADTATEKVAETTGEVTEEKAEAKAEEIKVDPRISKLPTLRISCSGLWRNSTTTESVPPRKEWSFPPRLRQET